MSKDGKNVSAQDVDVRAITKFYMSNTSKKQKDGRQWGKIKQKKNEDIIALAKMSSIDTGKYIVACVSLLTTSREFFIFSIMSQKSGYRNKKFRVILQIAL